MGCSTSKKVCGGISEDHIRYLDMLTYKTIDTGIIESIIKEYTISLIDPIPFKTYKKSVWAMQMINNWNNVSITWGDINFYFVFFWSTTA